VGRSDERAWTGGHSHATDVRRFGTSDRDPSASAGSLAISDHPASAAPPGETDERAIVTAVLAGDRDAYRRLVERESASIIRACYRVLGDRDEAEDAAQEAFLTAYRSLASWRSDGPFGAWLSRIAVRIALRQASKRRTVAWRSPAGGQVDDGAPTPADRAIEQASISATSLTDPAAMSVRAEQATEVRRAVTALPEPYREVVALRFFGGASLDEIATQTGRPLGTVKTHLHRGLARLRKDLEGRAR
jgi:RNA polymerase sigma-70 factor, ECF subfamily